MTVREYIGARYVPLFMGEWNIDNTYEPLSIVSNQGNSYTSRQAVPSGIPLTDESYWAMTGNYNAQIEQYRQEVREIGAEIDGIESSVTTLENIIPSVDFSDENTVKEYIDEQVGSVIDIGALLPSGDFSTENTVKDYVDGIGALLPSVDFSTENTVKDYVDSVAKREMVKSNILNAVADFRFDYQDDGYTGAQASCVFDINNVRYYAVGLITGSIQVDLNAVVRIYRLADSALISTVNVGGHCNCITFHDGKLYVSGGVTTQIVYIIDVSDPNNIVLEDTRSFAAFASRVGLGTSGWFSATKIDSGYYMAHQADGRIWQTDDNFSNESLILTLRPRDVNESAEQYLAYYPAIDLFAYVFADRIEWYDTDGSLYKVTNFERNYNFCARGEIEGISVFDNGDFYFSNNNIPAYGAQLSTPFYISTLFKTNLNTCDSPTSEPIQYIGDPFGIIVNDNYDLIPNLDTAYVGYSRNVYLKSPGDIMAVYEQMGLNTCSVSVMSDIDMPIVLTGVVCVLNLNEHLVPGIYLAQARVFLYGHAAAYASNDIEMAFTDGGHPTFVFGRGAVFTCAGVNAKNGDRYLISNGFGFVTVPQATIDLGACRLFNNTVHLEATNVS